MDVVVERCCGLDVHQQTVVACLLVGAAGQRARKEIRTFSTFTGELEAMRDWLQASGCQQVAMESTGIYWQPVYAVLEGSMELVVGNAAHIKNVPGRKTDMKDAEWLAQLLRSGLIRKSYVPAKPIRVLRKYVRYRRSLVQARTAERNRLQKLLESCNIKLGSVASDIFGKSGWRMLQALVAGDRSAEQMADLAVGLLRKKLEALAMALRGRLEAEDRWLLRTQMHRLEEIDADISRVEAEIELALAPHAELRERLMTIPGISTAASAVLIAEIGTNVDTFASDRHLAKWAGVCPGNNESAGKQVGRVASRGNIHLKSVLVEVANAAVRKKGTYYRAKFHRLKARRGYGRALMAIAHKLLRAVYHVIKTGQVFADLGEAYLDRRDQRRLLLRHLARIEALGYTVAVSPRLVGAT